MSWFGRNIAGKAAKRAWPAPADQLAAGDARGVHRESKNMSATLVALDLLASRLPGILMMDEACEYTCGSDKAKVANAKKALKAMAIDVHEEVSDLCIQIHKNNQD